MWLEVFAVHPSILVYLGVASLVGNPHESPRFVAHDDLEFPAHGSIDRCCDGDMAHRVGEMEWKDSGGNGGDVHELLELERMVVHGL